MESKNATVYTPHTELKDFIHYNFKRLNQIIFCL